MKRLFDLLASLYGLILLSPLLLLVGAAVAASSRGPILFRQQRVGLQFRRFTLYKFRTMVAGAEAGIPLTVEGDARVTRVGRLLRRTKFDELPQLINVLKGDMSLVGPRPEVPKYVELFRRDYEEVLTVRPGITDYAAIEFQDEEKVLKGYADPEAGYVQFVLPAKIALYRKYIRDHGMLTDVKILVATVGKIFKG